MNDGRLPTRGESSGGEAPRKRGRPRTPLEIVEQVRLVYEATKLAGDGNYSETARICGVSYVTVRKIILGIHGQKAENLGSQLAPGERVVEPQRCPDPDCRALISVLPCRSCKTRRELAATTAASLADGRGGTGAPRRRPTDARGQRLLPIIEGQPPEELQPLRDSFELKLAHRRRLEEVRARRQRLNPFADINRSPRPRDRRQTNRQELPF